MLGTKITLALMRSAYKVLVVPLCNELDRHIRGCEVVNWIRLAQNVIEWQILVNRVMNLNFTHKAEIYGDVSGSKWQINSLAAQRLGVLNEAIRAKTTAHRQNIWNLLCTYSLCTQIYILMKCSLKRSTRTFHISSPGWFSLRWRSLASERRLIYVSGKIELWNADRRIDKLTFESFLMRGITDMCCKFLNYKNDPGELTGLQFRHSKWYTSSGLTTFLGPVYWDDTSQIILP